jgi:hypothetical protein
MDIVMSARCVTYLLGGSPGHIPDRVPPRLADLLQRVGTADDKTDADAWQLRNEVGEVGRALFGRPAFHPIDLR